MALRKNHESATFKTKPVAAGTCASSWARTTSRAGRWCAWWAAISAFRSSITCFLTCPATAMRRCHPRCGPSARYGLPYNSAPLTRPFGTTLKRVFRLALPNRVPNGLPSTAW